MSRPLRSRKPVPALEPSIPTTTTSKKPAPRKSTQATTTAQSAVRTRSTITTTLPTRKSTRTAPLRSITQSPAPSIEHSDPPTPSTIIPSTPATSRLRKPDAFSSPAQSSNAENHSPHLSSSPPIAQSTPKPPLAPIDFSSDAGYTPPSKRRLGSAMRPRLQDLDTRTLEPIGAEEEEEDEEDGVRLPSPTPRRGGGRGGGFLLDEMGEEDEEGDGVVVVNRAPLERPEGGVGFLIDGGEFMIYSDPKSKTPSVVDDTPRKNTYTRQGNDDDDIMRPPMSSVSPSPSPTRKRRSSEVAESEGELTAVEITPRSKRPRAAAAAAAARGKAKTAKAAHNTRSKDKFLTTDALRDLLPTRKTVKTKTYEILTDYEEEEEVEEDEVDELSRPVRRGRSAKKKVETKAKVVKAKASRGKALTSAKKPPSRMYTKKAVVDEEEGSSDLTPVPSSDTASTIEIGDGVVKKEGRKKLKELKQKFEQVDKWEMEFEDVSQRTLEESSDSLKR